MSVLRHKPFAHIFDDAPKYMRAPDQRCDHASCAEEGTYRAPKNRDGEVLWLCLSHVREYNSSWNYYSDIPDEAIEGHIRNNIVWDRPSWPLNNSYTQRDLRDPFDLEELQKSTKRKSAPATKKLSERVEIALRIFSLGYPYTLSALKIRYRELVKLYHPDIHKDDPACIEQLQKINESYKILREAF